MLKGNRIHSLTRESSAGFSRRLTAPSDWPASPSLVDLGKIPEEDIADAPPPGQISRRKLIESRKAPRHRGVQLTLGTRLTLGLTAFTVLVASALMIWAFQSASRLVRAVVTEYPASVQERLDLYEPITLGELGRVHEQWNDFMPQSDTITLAGADGVNTGQTVPAKSPPVPARGVAVDSTGDRRASVLDEPSTVAPPSREHTAPTQLASAVSLGENLARQGPIYTLVELARP